MHLLVGLGAEHRAWGRTPDRPVEPSARRHTGTSAGLSRFEGVCTTGEKLFLERIGALQHSDLYLSSVKSDPRDL